VLGREAALELCAITLKSRGLPAKAWPTLNKQCGSAMSSGIEGEHCHPRGLRKKTIEARAPAMVSARAAR
jgi:hypothetical protein